jgi:hypothetical protein
MIYFEYIERVRSLHASSSQAHSNDAQPVGVVNISAEIDSDDHPDTG